MRKIFKYPLNNSSETTLSLPSGAIPLRVDTQEEGVFLWAEVDPSAEKTPRTFEVFGTGHDMPEGDRRYINTFLVRGGAYVFHAFERL